LVAVKDFRFIAPVLVGDLVELYARLASVGHSSLGVEVQGWAQGEPDPRSRRQVARAHIVYVAVDAQGRPRPVAPAPVLA
jgi:acyl-CoA thioesterase YciA